MEIKAGKSAVDHIKHNISAKHTGTSLWGKERKEVT